MDYEELRLRIYGDEVLRKRADEISDFGPAMEKLARRMFEIMYEEDGVGLAAPQAGESCRLAVLDVPLEGEESFTGVLINPKVVESRGTQTDVEGCLSIPGIREQVVRPQWIRVEGFDVHGEPVAFEAEGLLARAVQHEIDHLNGVLFVDRLSPIRRRLLDKKLKRIAAEYHGLTS